MRQGQFQTLNRLKSRDGQAVIEYVLVLIITLGLVLSARGLFVGVQNFIKGYMGDYVKCLMAHGELPSRGLENSDLNKNATSSYICAKQFSFSIGSGFQANSGQNRSQSSEGRSGTSSKASNSKNRSLSSEKSDNAKNADAESSESKIVNREKNRKSRQNNSATQADSPLKAENASSTRVADGSASDESGPRVIGELSKDTGTDSEGRSSGRPIYRGITGKMAEDIEKNSKTAQRALNKGRGSGAFILDDGSALGPRKSFMNLPELKQPKLEEENEDQFTAGKLLKWLMISGLVIMIVIFFGGQILNYSNTDN